MGSSVVLDGVRVEGSRGERILGGVDLRIAPGESVAVIGRSGAGKTTILRLLTGMVRPAAGTVSIDGKLLDGDLTAVRRRTGTILQAPALFPHRSVYDNVSTVPRLLGWDEPRIRRAASDLLQMLGMPLERFGPRFPRSLSGGEQQRVAIARAMIAAPPLLLCDEPFGALDPLVRRDLQDEIVRIREAGDVTVLFVTHDLQEALRVAGRIVLVDAGAIVVDVSRRAFLSSETPLVRRFIEAAQLPEAS